MGAAVAAQGLIVLDRTTQVLLVPRSAVIDDGGKKFVFKLSAGRALRQRVTLGAVDGDFVIVQQGVSEADVVVVDNLRSMKPGSRVRAAADSSSLN
jgi:membrane fusion protein (multidrug efflux system)